MIAPLKSALFAENKDAIMRPYNCFWQHPPEKSIDSIELDTLRTYAVIAYLLTFQPFLTVLCSQNALISVKCVSPALFSCQTLKRQQTLVKEN
jgi:hypothetical protein